jgi:DNA polymerase alpha subunit B
MPDFVVRHVPGAPKPDRITSVMGELLQQRSFYPLFPPGEGSQLEITQQDKLALPVSPDVMILGSKLNRMAKVGGTGGGRAGDRGGAGPSGPSGCSGV